MFSAFCFLPEWDNTNLVSFEPAGDDTGGGFVSFDVTETGCVVRAVLTDEDNNEVAEHTLAF